MIWNLQLFSLFSSVSSVHSKDEGRVHAMGVCVAVYFYTSWVCVGGHMGVSRALKDSTALCYRRGEGGQRVNGRFCPAAPSVSETESAVLFRLPLFFLSITLVCSHFHCLSSSHTCACTYESCWMWKTYASRCLI